MKQDIEFAVPLFKAGAEWRINSVWHSITVIPDCHRFAIFIPKKVGMTKRFPVMEKLILLNTGIIKTLWNFLEMWQPIYGWNIRSLNKEVDCLI